MPSPRLARAKRGGARAIRGAIAASAAKQRARDGDDGGGSGAGGGGTCTLREDRAQFAHCPAFGRRRQCLSRAQ
eukprot:365497-Chlamydomonas_euryale.AAC.8